MTPNGFSVLVRALLDTGCSRSLLKTELANLLIERGALAVTYKWPERALLLTGHRQTLYRSLSGLRLQSVESESGRTIDVSSHPFTIDEDDPFYVESTPLLSLVGPKLASLGLPIFCRRLLSLERTMWSEENAR